MQHGTVVLFDLQWGETVQLVFASVAVQPCTRPAASWAQCRPLSLGFALQQLSSSSSKTEPAQLRPSAEASSASTVTLARHTPSGQLT